MSNLRQNIIDHFSEDDLRTLCFELKTDFDALPGSGKNAKARELGLSFESGALDLLVQMAGDDTRQLENEIEKIDLYLGERRRCGINTVRGLVSMSRAGVIWEIGNAIGTRDLQRALKLLGVLMYQGQNAIGILLGSIVPRVRSLLIVKELASKHRLITTSYSSFTNSLDMLPPSATSHVPR